MKILLYKWVHPTYTIAFLLITLLLYTGCSDVEQAPYPEVLSKNAHDLGENRTIEEALKLAASAHSSIYGNSSDAMSRSELDLFDPAHPYTVILSSPKSRAIPSDTCIYIVNFAENNGFAIIAANRNVDGLLAITGEGFYDPTNGSGNPGVEYFIQLAKEYIEEAKSDGGSSIMPLDASFTEDERIQSKEWEDSTFTVNIQRRVNNSWNPGIINDSTHLTISNINTNPTGHYFSNGYCGKAVIAIAQAMLYFSYPATIPATTHTENMNAAITSEFSPNWDNLKQHRRYYTESRTYGCTPTERSACHEQIALLCRAIANIGKCKESGNSFNPKTTIKPAGVTDIILRLGFHTVQWAPYESTTILSNSRQIIIVNAYIDDYEDYSHYWIIDGEKQFTARHHFSTRKNSTSPWVDTVTATYTGCLIHINWGQHGTGDGWYAKAPFCPRTTPSVTYKWPFYTIMSLPDNI